MPARGEQAGASGQPVHSADADAWFVAFEHPLLEVMRFVRDAVPRADSRVTECIEWKSQTFVYDGDIASINPGARRFVQLMFQRGAEIPGDFPTWPAAAGRRST